MRNTYVLIDTSYLCYVAFHGIRGRTGADAHPNTVLLSMLDRVRQVVQQFDGTHLLFCFDGKPPLHRSTMYKGYKAHRAAARAEKDPDEVAALDALRRKIWELPAILQQHGFPVADQPGYEADDMLAQAINEVVNSEDSPDVILVTSDEDMFQCLKQGVTMVTPGSKHPARNGQWVAEKYGVIPEQWARVKAIAGCSTDNVPGVPGVGDKTAAKYVNGTLSVTTKAWQSIEAQLDACKARMPMVRLPWPHAALPSDWRLRAWNMTKYHALCAALQTELDEHLDAAACESEFYAAGAD